VDWSETGAAAGDQPSREPAKKERRENKTQQHTMATGWSPKTILGAIAVALLAVIAYAVLFEKRPGVEPVQQQASQPMPMNAPMLVPAEIQELESKVAGNPDDMALTLQLANLLHDGRFYEKAIPYYKKYVAKNPRDANARVDLGICYNELGRFTDAKNEMKTALRSDPNHLFAHFNLGIVCLSEGNFDEANSWFKKTVALDPNSEVGKRAQQLLTQHNSQTPKQN